jgi:hypothetical protein
MRCSRTATTADPEQSELLEQIKQVVDAGQPPGQLGDEYRVTPQSAQLLRARKQLDGPHELVFGIRAGVGALHESIPIRQLRCAARDQHLTKSNVRVKFARAEQLNEPQLLVLVPAAADADNAGQVAEGRHCLLVDVVADEAQRYRHE